MKLERFKGLDGPMIKPLYASDYDIFRHVAGCFYFIDTPANINYLNNILKIHGGDEVEIIDHSNVKDTTDSE